MIKKREDGTVFIPGEGLVDAFFGTRNFGQFGFVKPPLHVFSGQIPQSIQSHPIAPRRPLAFFNAKHFFGVIATIRLLKETLSFEEMQVIPHGEFKTSFGKLHQVSSQQGLDASIVVPHRLGVGFPVMPLSRRPTEPKHDTGMSVVVIDREAQGAVQ